MIEGSARGPAASTGGPTSIRLAGLLGAVVVVAVILLILQARLVRGPFLASSDASPDASLEDSAVQLPSSLDPLVAGPGPLSADLPFVLSPGRSTSGADADSASGISTGDDSSGGGGARSTAADVGSWAERLSAGVGIPPVALAAYGAAQLAVAASDPGCQLSWPTLAGIGYIESQHGSYGGAILGADGRSTPPIVGVALDGRTGIALISDTDDGALDGDPTLDRAVGPMQFIPSTWAVWGADGDGDGTRDPFDIDDAALAAGRYLCAAGGDLTTGGGWTRSIYAYNTSDRYVLDVRAAADEYAVRSAAS